MSAEPDECGGDGCPGCSGCWHPDDRTTTDRLDPDLGWVPAAPLPFYAPPTFRSVLWALIRRKPRPEWRAVRTDPNPTESRWRRG